MGSDVREGTWASRTVDGSACSAEYVSPWGPLMFGMAVLLGLAAGAWHGLTAAATPTQADSYQETASRSDTQWLGPADRLAFEGARDDATTPASARLSAVLAPWLAHSIHGE